MYREFLLIFALRLRQLVVPELSPHFSHLVHISNEFLEVLSLSCPTLLVVEIVLFEIQHLRDGRSPNPVIEHKLVAEAH